MIVYIIKDNNNILGVYKNLNDAYDFIIFINSYINKKFNEKNITKSIKIYKYKNNVIKKIYSFNKNLNLIDENYNNINIKNDFNNNSIIDNNESSDINIFIPNENEVDNIDDLKEKIDLLEKLKIHEVHKLDELKEDYIKKEERYIEDKIKIDNKKLKLKQEQEKWDSLKKKFEADKNLFYLFKKEIDDNIRNKEDLPELFKDIYPIFEKLDNDGYLNTIQEINEYVELIKN
jgi:hypothetical protein